MHKTGVDDYLAAGGTAVVLCDPCWEHAGRLVIVPSNVVVTARCDRCGAYGNPRNYEGVRPAGRKDCLGGTCRMCVESEG